MRQLLSTFIQTLLSADADAECGAAHGTVSVERKNIRNGYRHRDLETRVGTIDVANSKLRTGTDFPEWLLQWLGITRLSKSQASEMSEHLDTALSV